MKKTTIVTARIQRSYYNLIQKGIKKYEVRDCPFEGADAIWYIDSETNKGLSLQRLSKASPFSRNQDELTMRLSAVDGTEFYELFPPSSEGGPSVLWVARIGEEVPMEQLLAVC